MKKLLAFLLALMMALSLAACGSSKTAGYASDSVAVAESAPEAPNGFEMPAEEPERPFDAENSKGWSATGDVMKLVEQQSGVKMIYRATLEMQTLEFETAQEDIAKVVEEFGGYFENKSVSSYSSSYRSANYTVRIPTERFEAFCNQMGELCHVVWTDSSAENITEAYFDTASRLKTEQIKLERLQELLARADDMADIITIESAIGETEYMIESLQGTLRSYDSLVDYSTVYLNLSEVYKYSGTEDAPRTFSEKLGAAFKDGLRAAGELLEDLAVWFAYNWLLIIIWAAVIFAVWKIVRRLSRGRLKLPKLGKKAKTETGAGVSAENKTEE